jgi:hypothetical protein
MEEKRVFELPEVTTYDREELEIHTTFTGDGSGKERLSDTLPDEEV